MKRTSYLSTLFLTLDYSIMRIKVFAFIVIVATTFSCNDTNKSQSNITPKQLEVKETPKVFNQKDDNYLGTVYSRYDSDLISKLYEEAIEKDSKLKKLNTAINKMAGLKKDSIEEYSEFSQTNKSYWLTTNRYISQLQDSALKESTLEIFKALELKYQIKISDYEQKLTVINEKTLLLNDQLILIKLLITEPLMENYQMNEKPDIKVLENIILQYDNLIKETQEYTEDVK